MSVMIEDVCVSAQMKECRMDESASRDPLALLSERVEADDVARAAAEDEGRRLSLLRAMRGVRETMGLSQRHVADAMTTTQSAVSEIESGRGGTQLQTLQRYARALESRLDVAIVDDDLPAYQEGMANGLWQVVERRSLGPLFTALVTEAGPENRTLEELAEEHVKLPTAVVRPILDDLEVRGWVKSEPGTGEGKSYSLSEGAAYVIGISIHGDRVEGVLLDLRGRVRHDRTRTLTSRHRSTVQLEVRAVVRALHDENDEHDVLGVGVALAGLVKADGRRRETGEVIFAPELRGGVDGDEWRGVPLETELQDHLRRELDANLLVAVENDANALAMAEYVRHGDSSVIAVLIAQTGIGAGFALKGQVAHGAHFAAGELGHLIVDRNSDQPCPSGFKHTGCLETMSGLKSIVAALDLPAGDWEQTQASLVIANHRLDNGDMAVRDAFVAAGEALGRTLATSVAFLDPNRLVFYGPRFLVGSDSGGISCATAIAFREGVTSGLDRHLPTDDKFAEPHVDWSVLSENTIAIAAGQSALRHFLVDPWHWNPRVLSNRASEGSHAPAGAP